MSRASKAAIAVVGLVVLAGVFWLYDLFDFRVFWLAGHRVLAGERIYPSRHALALDTRSYFVYPPVVAMLFAPFSLVPFPVAAVVYIALSVSALVLALRIVGVSDRRCYIALLFWMPVLQAFSLGTIMPFLALSLAIVWKRRDSRWTMPLVLALAIVSKLFLWPLGFWLLATRRWRATLTFAAASVALVILPWALLGFRDLRWYPKALALLLHNEQATSFSTHEALAAVGLASATPVIEVVAIFAVFWLSRRCDGDRRAFSAAVICALLVSPLAWVHYFVILAVPIALKAPNYGRPWVLPIFAFWLPTTNLGHPLASAVVFAMLTLAGVSALRANPESAPPDYPRGVLTTRPTLARRT